MVLYAIISLMKRIVVMFIMFIPMDTGTLGMKLIQLVILNHYGLILSHYLSLFIMLFQQIILYIFFKEGEFWRNIKKFKKEAYITEFEEILIYIFYL